MTRLALILAFIPLLAWGQVGYDGVSTSVSPSLESSRSFNSPNVAGNTNRGGVVYVHWQNSTVNDQSVTWNGVSMTYRSRTRGNNNHCLAVYELANVPTGVSTVVVTMSGSTVIECAAYSVYNVNQTNVLGTPVAATGTGATASVSVSTSSANELVIGGATVGTDLTNGAGQTQRYNISNEVNGNTGAGATKAGTGGSVSLSWTVGDADDWTALAAKVNWDTTGGGGGGGGSGSTGLHGISLWAADQITNVYEDQGTQWEYANDSNAVWKTTGAVDSIIIWSCRNMFTGWQLVFRGGDTTVAHVNTWLPFLVNADGDKIENTSNDPTQFVGRKIEPFLGNPVWVTMRNAEGHWTNGKPLPDEDYVRRSFEQWLPLEADTVTIVNGDGEITQGGAGNSTNARSGGGFTVQANLNSVVLYDVFVDKTIPRGEYYGSVRAWVVGQTDTTSIPVHLSVYSPTLSDTNHYPVFTHMDGDLFANYGGTSYGDGNYWNYWKKTSHLFHRHRMDIQLAQEKIDTIRVREMGYFTGWRYTAGQGYAGPGVGVGNRMYSANLYGTNFVQFPPMRMYLLGSYGDTQAGWRSATDDLYTLFSDSLGAINDNAVGGRIISLEGIDEPNTVAQRDSMNTRADWVRTGTGTGNKKIHLFMPLEAAHSELMEHSPASGYTISWDMPAPDCIMDGTNGYRTQRGSTTNSYEAEQIRSMTASDSLPALVGTYNSHEGSVPQMEYRDHGLAEVALWPWVMPYYDIDYWFLWTTTSYTQSGSGANGWQTIPDVGAGNYLYLGKDVKYAAENRNLEMPIASARIKALRNGLQHAEMIWLAKQAAVMDTNWYHHAGLYAAFNDWLTWPTKHTSSGPSSWTYLRGFTVEAAAKEIALALDAGSGTETLEITTSSPLTAGTVGSAYSLALGSTGGTAPYAYETLSGSLPGGLSLSEAGILSGTPTDSGIFSFTVQVTDDADATATKAFSLTINVSSTPRAGLLPWHRI